MNHASLSKQVFIKMCGFRRPADAVAAAAAGADAIGLNFFAGPRQISLADGTHIIAALGSPRQAVALVSAAPKPGETTMQQVFEMLGIAVFQLYNLPLQATAAGFEPLAKQGCSFWPVIRVAQRGQLAALGPTAAGLGFLPAAILLDSHSAAAHGGTGESFNWQWIADARQQGELAGLPPLILAGGLNPGNVAAAVATARPWGVDVASGIEAGIPGEKDIAAMQAFVAAVRQAWTNA